jgi:AcrR family transcriptional regulator
MPGRTTVRGHDRVSVGGDLKGRAHRGAERRQAILDAAIDVFGARGYRGGALAEVAERVGIGAPAVLYHFGSKKNLLLEVLKERDRRAGEMVAELPASAGLNSLAGIVVLPK